METFSIMGQFDQFESKDSIQQSIRPTGLGYRGAANTCLAVSALLWLFGPLTLISTNPQVSGKLILFFFCASSAVLALGVILRIVSDFLVVLLDIARALRESR
jgi:hypothetical protein